MLPGKIAFASLSFFLVFAMAYGQTNDKQKGKSIFDWLYTPEEVVAAELQTDLDVLADQKMTNNEIEGAVTFTNAAGERLTIPVRLRARGRFRRRICEFPPVKLDFAKDALKANGLNNYDEYKLVTHCFISRSGDDNVLKEYLAYRLYQELTDKSFRVQLLKVKYLDNDNKDQMTAYAILIEDEKEMAARLNCKLQENRYNVPADSLLLAAVHQHDLFQYMISNTDWSLPMVRNMKLLWDPQAQRYFIIPYDFDFSGLVNAPYALPNADYGQKNIRERHYLGIASSVGELTTALDQFRSRHSAFIERIKGFKLLGSTERRDMIKYLDSFYDNLENGTLQADLTKD